MTLSVVIPAYNVGQYVAQCLQSVLSQSFTDFEVIVVNDGSTDNSAEIARSFADADSRVRVVDQSNGGLSAARNTGIDLASGEWLMFVDSDDMLLPDAMSTLLALAHDTESDIVCGGFVENLPYHTPKHAKQHTYSSQQALLQLLYQRDLTCSAWGKIYRRCLFDDIRFRKGILYEDLDIAHLLFAKANSVSVTTWPVYYYRHNPSSILNNFTPNRLDVLDVTERISNWAETVSPDVVKAALSRRFSANFNILGLLAANNLTDRQSDVADACYDFIRKYRCRVLLDPGVRIKNKLGAVASLTGRKFILKILGRHYRNN